MPYCSQAEARAIEHSLTRVLLMASRKSQGGRVQDVGGGSAGGAHSINPDPVSGG